MNFSGELISTNRLRRLNTAAGDDAFRRDPSSESQRYQNVTVGAEGDPTQSEVGPASALIGKVVPEGERGRPDTTLQSTQF